MNILSDLSRWQQRRELLVQEMTAIQPDLVALQEAAVAENTAGWLGEQLSMQVYLQPKTGEDGKKEGIAILSRLPVSQYEWLDLRSQNRVAQRVHVQYQDQPLVFANGHFFWHPGPSPDQTAQVELFLQWLEPFEGQAVVVCGDFNALPEFPAIEKMRQKYQSAYAVIHGQEPEYTFPTPLKRPFWSKLTAVLHFVKDIRFSHFRAWNWGTVDYIFVNHALTALNCQLVFNTPHPQDTDLFASDHFGLFAELSFSAATPNESQAIKPEQAITKE